MTIMMMMMIMVRCGITRAIKIPVQLPKVTSTFVLLFIPVIHLLVDFGLDRLFFLCHLKTYLPGYLHSILMPSITLHTYMFICTPLHKGCGYVGQIDSVKCVCGVYVLDVHHYNCNCDCDCDCNGVFASQRQAQRETSYMGTLNPSGQTCNNHLKSM